MFVYHNLGGVWLGCYKKGKGRRLISFPQKVVWLGLLWFSTPLHLETGVRETTFTTHCPISLPQTPPQPPTLPGILTPENRPTTTGNFHRKVQHPPKNFHDPFGNQPCHLQTPPNDDKRRGHRRRKSGGLGAESAAAKEGKEGDCGERGEQGRGKAV